MEKAWKYIVILLSLIVLGCGIYICIALNPPGMSERLDLALVRIPSTDCKVIVTSVRNSAMDDDYIQISKECDGDRAIVSRIFGFDSVGYVGINGDSLLVQAMFTVPDTNGRQMYALKIR